MGRCLLPVASGFVQSHELFRIADNYIHLRRNLFLREEKVASRSKLPMDLLPMFSRLFLYPYERDLVHIASHPKWKFQSVGLRILRDLFRRPEEFSRRT